MSEEAMDVGVHGVEVKLESEDEVEPYDGTYACCFCSESCTSPTAVIASSVAHWVGLSSRLR